MFQKNDGRYGDHDELWRGCGVLVGILLFFIIEQLLHLIVYKVQVCMGERERERDRIMYPIFIRKEAEMMTRHY